MRRAEQRIGERQYRRRGREANRWLAIQSAVPSIGGVKRLTTRPSAKPVKFTTSGSMPLAKVGENEHDHQRRKNGPLQGFRREAEGAIASQKSNAGEEFDQGIHRRDFRFAGAAFAAEEQVADHGNVVVGANGRAAFGASRRGHHDRFALGDSDDADVQEAANDQPEEEHENADKIAGVTI